MTRLQTGVIQVLEQRISIERLEQAVNIFGSFDENIRLLEQEFSVSVVNRDGELRVEGEAEDTMAGNDRRARRYSGLRWRLAHSGEERE